MRRLENLGPNIRARRQRKGVSVEVASGFIGVNAPQLRKYERGDIIPSTKRLLYLADYYDCTLDALFEEIKQ